MHFNESDLYKQNEIPSLSQNKIWFTNKYVSKSEEEVEVDEDEEKLFTFFSVSRHFFSSLPRKCILLKNVTICVSAANAANEK